MTKARNISKLSAVEVNADATDTTNVTSSGALMDSELTNLAAVKAINQSLVTTADAAFASLTIPSDIIHTGDADTLLQFNAADSWRVITGDEERLKVSNGEVIINDNSVDMDFRVESNGNTHALFVQGSSGNVGIGTNSPNSAADLHVADTSDARIWLEATSGDTMELYAGTNVSLFNRSNNALTFGTNNAERMRIDSSGNVGIGTTSTSSIRLQAVTPTANHVGLQVENSNTADSFGMIVKGGNDANDYTADFRKRDNTNIMRIRGDGNVGIGTASPQEKLHIFNSSNSWNQYANIRMSSESDTYAAEIGFHRGTSNDNDRGLFLSGNGSTQHVKILHGGNVGIGTASPTFTLDVYKSAVGDVLRLNSTSGNRSLNVSSADNGNFLGAKWTRDINSAGGIHCWSNDATERMRIDSSGTLAVGTTVSPTWTVFDGRIRLGARGVLATTTGSTQVIHNAYYDGSYKRIGGTDFAGRYYQNDGSHVWDTAVAGAADSAISFVERMRILNSGNVSIGTSSETSGNKVRIDWNGSAGYGLQLNTTSTSGTQYMATFTRNGTQAGYIVTNAGNTTTYVTSSDYRLKQNVDYTWDATTRLKQLKPARFEFIVDAGTVVDGFLAHEVSSIVPEAIVGEKDGEQMQGIDQSKLVPLLVKTIQELEARITALEA